MSGKGITSGELELKLQTIQEKRERGEVLTEGALHLKGLLHQ